MELITTAPKEDGKWLLLYGDYADGRDDRHTGFIQGYWLDDFNGWYTQCGFPINATKWSPLPPTDPGDT